MALHRADAGRPVERADPYTLIHKGQRQRLFEMALAIGSLDPRDQDKRHALTAAIQVFLDSLALHTKMEDRHILPLIQECDPDAAHRLEVEHGALQLAGGWLREQVAKTSRDNSAAEDLQIYRGLNRFIGSYLAHIDSEEQMLPSLWTSIDLSRLRSAEEGLLRDLPPQGLVYLIEMSLPAGTVSERLALLGCLRRVVGARGLSMMHWLRAALDPAEWDLIQSS